MEEIIAFEDRTRTGARIRSEGGLLEGLVKKVKIAEWTAKAQLAKAQRAEKVAEQREKEQREKIQKIEQELRTVKLAQYETKKQIIAMLARIRELEINRSMRRPQSYRTNVADLSDSSSTSSTRTRR